MPSLKQFHILFVLVSMALCIFLAYWAYSQDLMSYLVLFFISILVLFFYGLRFYNKVKNF
jgi:hypothetical protein